MKTDTQTHNIRSNRFNGESIQLTDKEAKKHIQTNIILGQIQELKGLTIINGYNRITI